MMAMSDPQDPHKQSPRNSISQPGSRRGSQLHKHQSDDYGHGTRHDKLDIDAKLAELKALAYEGMCQNKHLYSPKDAHLFFEMPEYNYPLRFLQRVDMNVSKAVEMILSAAKWRNQQGLPDLVDTSFPKIAYLYGLAFIYGEDVHGNLVVHMRFKLLRNVHRTVGDMLDLFVNYLGFKADQMSSGQNKGWIILIDFTGATVKNWDMNFLLNVMKILHYYTPAGLKGIYTYGLSRALNPLMKMLTKLMPGNILKLLSPFDKQSLLEHISQDNLPRYLGGICEKDPRVVPEGCPDDEEYFVPKYNLQNSKFKEIQDKYNAIMKETEW